MRCILYKIPHIVYIIEKQKICAKNSRMKGNYHEPGTIREWVNPKCAADRFQAECVGSEGRRGQHGKTDSATRWKICFTAIPCAQERRNRIKSMIPLDIECGAGRLSIR